MFCSASRELGVRERGRGGWRERERERRKENHIAAKSALISSGVALYLILILT